MADFKGVDTTERVLGGGDRTKRKYKTVPTLVQLCLSFLGDHCDCVYILLKSI